MRPPERERRGRWVVQEGPPPSWDRGLKGGGEGRVGWVEEEEEAVKGLDTTEPTAGRLPLGERAVPSGGQWAALPSCPVWRQGRHSTSCKGSWVAALGGKGMWGSPSPWGPHRSQDSFPTPNPAFKALCRLLPTFPSNVTALMLPHVLSAGPHPTLPGHFHLRAFAQAVPSAWSAFPSHASKTSKASSRAPPPEACVTQPQGPLPAQSDCI